MRMKLEDLERSRAPNGENTDLHEFIEAEVTVYKSKVAELEKEIAFIRARENK